MTSKILIDDISDHLPCVTIIGNLLPSKAFKRTITSRDKRPKNLESLRTDLTASIPTLNPNLDVNIEFLDFHILLQSKIENHCPINTRTISKRNFRNEPWLTNGLLISSHKQKVLYQASLRKNSPNSSTIKYRNYRNLLTKLKRKCKLNYYKDKCKEFCRNAKKLWHVINTCIGKESDKTNIINYIKVGNIDVYDSKLIVDVLLIKLRQNVGLLTKSKNKLDRLALRSVYYAHIHSHLSYAISIWGSMLSTKQIQKLQKVQNTCLKTIEPGINITESFKKLKILRISQLVKLELNKLAYKHTHNLLPFKLAQCMNCDASGKSLEKQHHYLTRNKHLLNLPQVTMKKYQKSFLMKSISLYSALPKEIMDCQNLHKFAQSVKHYLQISQ